MFGFILNNSIKSASCRFGSGIRENEFSPEGETGALPSMEHGQGRGPQYECSPP